MSEDAILDVVKKNFKDHLILGEEGGVIGDTSSDYLWCIDPLGCLSQYLVFLGMKATYVKLLMYIPGDGLLTIQKENEKEKEKLLRMGISSTLNTVNDPLGAKIGWI